MNGERFFFALWSASFADSELLVLRRCGRVVELQLRGGSTALSSITLRRRD